MKYSWSCSFCVSPASTTDWSCALPPWNNFEGGASAKAKPLSSWESLWGAFSFSLSWVTLLYEYFCIRRLFTPSSGNKGGIFATTWLTPAGSPLSLRSTIPPSQQRWFRGYTPTMQCHAQEISACFPLVLLNPKLPFLFFVLHADARTQRDREY